MFSAVKEKEYETMIRMLCETIDAKEYILTQIENERGVSTEELAGVFGNIQIKDYRRGESRKGVLHGAERKGENDRVYCLGSLYLVGMLKELIVGGKSMLNFEEELKNSNQVWKWKISRRQSIRKI